MFSYSDRMLCRLYARSALRTEAWRTKAAAWLPWLAVLAVLYMVGAGLPGLLSQLTSAQDASYSALPFFDDFASGAWFSILSMVFAVLGIAASLVLALAVWPLFKREAIGWNLAVLFIGLQTVGLILSSLLGIVMLNSAMSDKQLTDGFGGLGILVLGFAGVVAAVIQWAILWAGGYLLYQVRSLYVRDARTRSGATPPSNSIPPSA